VDIVLNERKFAENYDKLKSGDKPFDVMLILAKYYYKCGYKKSEIEQMLKSFLKKTPNIYYPEKAFLDSTIEKVSSRAGKYELYEIDGIRVTKSELIVIRKIKNKSLEKIAFTLLCLAKLGNLKNKKNNNWVNFRSKKIFEFARVTAKTDQRDYIIHELHSFGLIELSRNRLNLNIQVKFINNGNDNELFVSDFRELGREYLKYCGENYIRCERCGLLVKGNKKRNKKYCNKCAGYLKVGMKTVVCVDCGEEFEVDSRNMKKIRCDECQKEYDRKLKIERNRRYYSKNH